MSDMGWVPKCHCGWRGDWCATDIAAEAALEGHQESQGTDDGWDYEQKPDSA